MGEGGGHGECGPAAVSGRCERVGGRRTRPPCWPPSDSHSGSGFQHQRSQPAAAHRVTFEFGGFFLVLAHFCLFWYSLCSSWSSLILHQPGSFLSSLEGPFVHMNSHLQNPIWVFNTLSCKPIPKRKQTCNLPLFKADAYLEYHC